MPALLMEDLGKKIGGVEGVENVAERLQAEIGKVDKVDEVLGDPLNGDVVVGEGEIEDELGAIEIGEKKAREKVEAEKMRKRLDELERVNEDEKKPAKFEDWRAAGGEYKRLSQMIIEDENRGSPEKKRMG
jgi:hypothetical protein